MWGGGGGVRWPIKYITFLGILCLYKVVLLAISDSFHIFGRSLNKKHAQKFVLNYEIYLMNKDLKHNMEGKIYTHQESTIEDFPNG